jgi:hypothetical protein
MNAASDTIATAGYFHLDIISPASPADDTFADYDANSKGCVGYCSDR